MRLKIAAITDTVLIDGVYLPERRNRIERRKANSRTVVHYERRKSRDPRLAATKSISIKV